MVAIGSCDYCGEFCSEVGLRPAEEFALPNGWIPTSAIERHKMWSRRRYECGMAGIDGSEPHVGPWHDPRGRPLSRCRNCYSPTHESEWSDWDATLDHQRCPLCGAVPFLRPTRQPPRRNFDPGRPWSPDSSFTPAELEADPVLASLSVEPAIRARAESALIRYFGPGHVRIEWHRSPQAIRQELADHLDPDEPFPARPPWSLWSLTPVSLVPLIPAGSDDHGGRPGPADAIRRVLPGSRYGIGDAGQFDTRTPVVMDRLRSDGRSGFRDEGFLRLMHELRSSAGPAIMLPGRVLISERPLRLRVDDRGRPHSEVGPAIAYPDGFRVWALHGVVVPAWLISDPGRLTVKAIESQRNAEVRRIMVERFGVERLVREGGAELINEDERGRLWRMAVRRGSRNSGAAIVTVEVVNSTPEPDGTQKTYFLRVPPSMRTATEAVAWTFGMGKAEYAPERET